WRATGGGVGHFLGRADKAILLHGVGTIYWVMNVPWWVPVRRVEFEVAETFENDVAPDVPFLVARGAEGRALVKKRMEADTFLQRRRAFFVPTAVLAGALVRGEFVPYPVPGDALLR